MLVTIIIIIIIVIMTEIIKQTIIIIISVGHIEGSEIPIRYRQRCRHNKGQ